MTRRLTIAIVGAGIGGLAAAALLAQAGQQVQVYDQFDAPRPVGSGLVIQPVGLDVLDRIGVGDLARAHGAAIRRMQGLEVSTGARVLDVTYDRQAGVRVGLAIHRASLFHALLRACVAAGVSLRSSAAVVSAPLVPAGRRLGLRSGQSEGPFDLVIDASGTHSVLSPLQGRTLPYGAVWATVPWPAQTGLPADRLTQRYRRASRMAGVLPIGRLPGEPTPLTAIFWSLMATGMPAWQSAPFADWQAEATEFWPDLAPFIDGLGGHHDMTLARYSHGTLRRPYTDRLAFIGDAAHRASPQLGQGANMALLDALALSIALDRAEGDDALALYAGMRRWHVRLYQGMSAIFTPQYQSDSHLLPVLRDRLLGPIAQLKPMQALLSHLVSGDLVPPIAGA